MELRRPDPTADFDEVLELVRACDRTVYGDSDWTATELREEWEERDLGRDAWVAGHDGHIAGVMHVFDRRGDRVIVDGYVHPELTGLGAGSLLLAAAEARALELAESAGDEGVTVETAHLVGDPRAPRLLEGRGYRYVRTFFRMVRDITGELPLPVWPEGIELRPLDPGRDGPSVHAALDEAFTLEWGYERRAYDDWATRAFGGERFDPALVLVAWDGPEIAAVSLNYGKQLGDWGFVRTLGVRPAWRRRGLGLALLHESFRRFAAAGETVVALGVDSENPTGATHLYEQAGMRILWRADVWQKELQDVRRSDTRQRTA